MYLPLLWANGKSVVIQCALNLDPSVHWNVTGEQNFGSQCLSSVPPVVLRWPSSVFQLCKLPVDCHRDTTGCLHQPVWFQWYPSVLVDPVVFQCVPILQVTTGLQLGDHWVPGSASVVLLASQCTCGSSDLPVCSNYANYHCIATERQLADSISQCGSSVVCPVVSQCTDSIWFGGQQVKSLASTQPLMNISCLR